MTPHKRKDNGTSAKAGPEKPQPPLHGHAKVRNRNLNNIVTKLREQSSRQSRRKCRGVGHNRATFQKDSGILDGKTVHTGAASSGTVKTSRGVEQRLNIFEKMTVEENERKERAEKSEEESTGGNPCSGELTRKRGASTDLSVGNKNSAEPENSKTNSPEVTLDDLTSAELFTLLYSDTSVVRCNCSLVFTDQILYYLHRNAHGTGGELRCGFCDYEAGDQYQFAIHQLKEHPCSGDKSS